MTKEMAEKGPDFSDAQLRIPKKETLKLPLWKKLGMTLTAAAELLSGCGPVKTPESSSSTPTEGLGGIPTETYTPTKTTAPAETVTPTEVPLFTEAEVKAADPFDSSPNLDTWPDRFRQTELHPETATDEEWENTHEFILAVREDKGILRTTEDNVPSGMESFSNAAKWMQENLEEARGKEVIISPVEERKMIEEERKIIRWNDIVDGKRYTYGFDRGVELTTSPRFFLDAKIIGPILGREDINAGRVPFDSVCGKLAMIGRIGENKKIVIDMKDKDDWHTFFSAVIYKNGSVLPEGTKCLVMDKNFGPIFTLPTDVELGPLASYKNGKAIDWNSLYKNLGFMVMINDYGAEVRSKVSSYATPECLDPSLNTEMAGRITFLGYK